MEKKVTLVLATRNRDKMREIRNILRGSPWMFRMLDDFPGAGEVVEDGKTLEENALKKARECHRHTGLPSLADDSGLEVDFLGGKPGVYSSRFAGPDVSYSKNNRKLLAVMEGVPEPERKAAFRCVVAFTDGDTEKTVEGRVSGLILTELRGREGFGYDPLFHKPEIGKTFAELPEEEKNRISHRGEAFRAMDRFLREYYGIG